MGSTLYILLLSQTVADAISTSNNTSALNPKPISSHQLLQHISKSQHAPGIRRAGCPCCDPDSASNYADEMLGI